MSGRIVIISAPSGTGKTTLLKNVLPDIPGLSFSVSATSRKPRKNEVDGKDYYFVTPEEFEKRVTENQFVEWEEVYEGIRYGTLRSELNRIWQQGRSVVFDVDVMGGMKIKKQYPLQSLSVFIRPPTMQSLRERLLGRATDDPLSIEKRLARAEYELNFASRFDQVIVNDNLQTAIKDLRETLQIFLSKNKP